MKFLALGDVLEVGCLHALMDFDLENYSFLLLSGDLAGLPDGWKIGRARANNDKSLIPTGKDPKEFYNEFVSRSVRKLREIDQILGHLKARIKIFSVYGNTDFKSVVNQVEPKSFCVIHKKRILANGCYLVGYNGHPIYPWEKEHPNQRDVFGFTFKETAREINSFDEDEIYNDLIDLTEDIERNRTIILTHTPPYKILDKVSPKFVPWAKASYGERSEKGNVGSLGLRKFIIKYQPILTIFGHIHESKGIEKINGTTCVNVGTFDERKEILIVEVKNEKVDCEFRRLD